MRDGLTGITVLLNCAGPFDRTATPLIDGCLHSGTHYLDLAGDVPEFQTTAARDAEAVQAGVMVLPGAGFGVVPTDCLAMHLHRRLPDATRLELAFQTVGGLLPQRAAARRMQVDFGQGPITVATNPWRADLVTAAYSTGIATIDAFTALPAPVRGLMRIAPRMPVLFGSAPWRAAMNALIRRLPAGPTDQQLAAGASRIWGRVSTPDGREAAATIHGPEPYEFTAQTARLLLRHILAGQAIPGFQTPASAYGADLVLELDDIRRIDIDTTFEGRLSAGQK